MASRIAECEHCGTTFEAKRSTARFCKQACQKAARAGKPAPKEQPLPTPEPTASTPVVAATRHELERAGKASTVAGTQALTVAERMDSALSSGSEIAALSRELSRLMLLAVGRGAQEEDPVDEVKRKRDEKLAKARQASG